jgi:Aminotransferase class-V
MKDRREFLSVAGRIAGSLALASGVGFARAMHAAEKLTAAGPDAAARDEAFWTTYRNAFTPDPGHKWFNCLAFNPTPASTHESFLNKGARLELLASGARGRSKAGACVIADGALTFGCMPVDLKTMDCDFYGTSLHKGVFAPTGTGFLYVKRERIRSVWPLYGAAEKEADDIRKFEHRGTAPVTAFAAVNDALDLHEKIGFENMAARYRYLKRLWADRLVGHSRCRFNVSLEPEHSCGIASLVIDGVEPVKLYEYLYTKREISAWLIRDSAFPALWVSPYPFTTPSELDVLASTLTEVANKGLPS